jgi:hypothetical protein
MNKQTKREGFVATEEAERTNGPVIDQPALPDASEPPQPPAPETWPVKVRLMHKPVRNNKGDMVHELTFREPTGGDINRYGNPCHVNQDGDVIIIEKKMTTMMAVLSGILQPFLEGMDPRDWNSCAYRLRGFFLPDPASW